MVYIKAFFGDLGNNMVIIFMALLALYEIINIVDKIMSRLGIETKWSLNAKKEKVMLFAHEETLNSILSDIKDIKRSSKDDGKATRDKINVLSQMIIEMQCKSDSTERAKLKDRIGQSYRYYHSRREWNNMEKEAFDDLIQDYEAHGGQNSFVHSVCEPESCTWKIIP